MHFKLLNTLFAYDLYSIHALGGESELCDTLLWGLGFVTA